MLNQRVLHILFALSCLTLAFVSFTNCTDHNSPFPSDPTPQVFDSCEVKTCSYSIQGPDTLELNIYRYSDEIRPVVLFVHGGGFKGGSHNDPFIQHFCDTLSSTGVHVISMSYRLTMKGKSFHCDQSSTAKVKAFSDCGDDILDALAMINDSARTWALDTSNIILAGSSAGAEAALHLAFNRNESHRFKALISMAGAMTDTTLITSENVIPTLLFHGSCDPLVPHGRAFHHYCEEDTPGALELCGSEAIFRKIEALHESVQIVIECGGDHSMANRAMSDHFWAIQVFCESVEEDIIPLMEVVETSNFSCDLPPCSWCIE